MSDAAGKFNRADGAEQFRDVTEPGHGRALLWGERERQANGRGATTARSTARAEAALSAVRMEPPLAASRTKAFSIREAASGGDLNRLSGGSDPTVPHRADLVERF